MKTTQRTRRNSKLIYNDTSSDEDDDYSTGSTVTVKATALLVTKKRGGGGRNNSNSTTSKKKKAKAAMTNKAIQMRRTNKERRLRNENIFNGGHWSQKERLDFLRGLRRFGPGKWKKIQTILTTRSNIQIKSHGQKILQRIQAGDDVYLELDLYEAANKKKEVLKSPTTTTTSREKSQSLQLIASPCPPLPKAKELNGSNDDDAVMMVTDDDVSLESMPTLMPSDDDPKANKKKEEKLEVDSTMLVDPPVLVQDPLDASSMTTNKNNKEEVVKFSSFPLDSSSIPTKQDLRLMQKKPVLSKKSAPLSIKEATVVLALVELAEPIKDLGAQVCPV